MDQMVRRSLVVAKMMATAGEDTNTSTPRVCIFDDTSELEKSKAQPALLSRFSQLFIGTTGEIVGIFVIQGS